VLFITGQEDLLMPRGSEDKIFAWMFAGVIFAIAIGDIALIWVLFWLPNSPEWLTSLRWPFARIIPAKGPALCTAPPVPRAGAGQLLKCLPLHGGLYPPVAVALWGAARLRG
jgi:hypothetical protein